MRCFRTIRALLLVAGVLALAVAASADTLEMKDGRVIRGKYMGGTQTHVRFEVNGQIDLYVVDQIVALTFTGGDSSTSGRDRSAATPRSGLAPAAESPRAALAPSGETSAAPQRVTVPAGTTILVRMIDSVDSEKNHVGDRFRASLEEDLAVDGVVVAPKGTDVYGRLSEAKEAGHLTGKSDLKLELTGILINQQLQPIVTGEYEVSGKSRGSNTAAKVGGGAVLGALIGAIAGGGKGAAIGAGVGAAGGTAIQVLTKGQQVRVPSETMLEFHIEQSFSAEPSRATVR